MFCKPSKANSTIPARHVGRQHSSQHRQRGSVPALSARFSEKRGSLGAQLFSESDPYLGASQEAEVFRNLAPSIGTGCFSKGESRAVKKKPRICLFSPEEKRQLIQSPCTVHSWTCTSRNACVRLHLLTQAGRGGQYLVRRHCCSERTADDSLLGHSSLSPNSKDLGLGPEFTKSTHGVFFQSSAQLNKARWMTSILSVLPRGKRKAAYVCSSEQTCCPFPIPNCASRYKCIGTSKCIPEVADTHRS